MKSRLAPLLLAAIAGLLPSQEVNFPFPGRLLFNSDFSGNHEIYMLQDNRLIQLTRHPACDEYAVASRAGDRIAFDSDRDGNFDVFLLDAKNLAVRPLTRDSRDERGSGFGPGDRSIYFSRLERDGRWSSMRAPLDGGPAEELFPGAGLPSLITLVQNRRGDTFFFTAKALLGWRVAKYDLLRRRMFKLTATGTCRPRVSPDDGWVAYVSGEADDLGDIWLMDETGGRKRNLTPERKEAYDYYPAFSPDGRWIAFSSSPKARGKQAYDLYVLEVASGKVTPIFRSAGNDVYPYWLK